VFVHPNAYDKLWELVKDLLRIACESEVDPNMKPALKSSSERGAFKGGGQISQEAKKEEA
jgi:hypothetical protein